MKYLFVGLGNIGSKYAHTRHNIGFDIVDELAKQFDATFEESRLAHTSSFKTKGKTIILIKPTTYMNLSGRAFRYYLQKEKIPIERSLVFVDDIALPFGKIRLKPKGSSAGHNGLEHIQTELNTKEYPRLRFGIGDNYSKGRQVEYVLGHWNTKEQEELPSYINDACKAALSFISLGLERTMGEFNS